MPRLLSSALFALALLLGCATTHASGHAAMGAGAVQEESEEAFDADAGRAAMSPGSPALADFAIDGVSPTGEIAAPPGEPAPTPLPTEPPRIEPDPRPPKPGADSPAQPFARRLVYTATMRIAVFDVEKAIAEVERLPQTHGGYVQSLRPGAVVLRIPAETLTTVMRALEGFGVVEERTLQAQDVTDRYVDLEARIRVLRQTREQLLSLLTRANTVEEALRVQTALDQVTMHLETLLGQMRQLENQVAFSTLTVTLIERGPHRPTPSNDDPFPWVNELGVEATAWK